MYELDEIGFIGSQDSKETEKVKIIESYLIRGSKEMRQKQGRNLTDIEREQIIKEAELAYNREVRQCRKLRTFGKVASVTL
jgi:hypothetical protein